MQDYLAKLEAENTYHIYNRAVGKDKLFLCPANYKFFLEKYKTYVHPLCDTLCYCLMPSHFHLIITFKSKTELLEVFKADDDLCINNSITRQFSNFFNSYSKALNKSTGRNGSLFARPFKRKMVSEQKYLVKLFHYIHFNPVLARLADSVKEWNFSSYRAIISDQPTLVDKKTVLALFEDKDNFIYCHTHPPLLTGIEDL